MNETDNDMVYKTKIVAVNSENVNSGSYNNKVVSNRNSGNEKNLLVYAHSVS